MEHATIRNVNFIDCKRAVITGSAIDTNSARWNGKLLELNIENSRFIYPYGPNMYLDSEAFSSYGGSQATFFTQWVKTAKFTNCYFDGAAKGDVTDSYRKYPVDGLIWGLTHILFAPEMKCGISTQKEFITLTHLTLAVC
jgi:hypothetical protein